MSQRLSVSFDSVATSALGSIRESMNAASVADVVRHALTVLSALLSAEKRGCQILLKSSDGQFYVYSLTRPTEMVATPSSLIDEPSVIKLEPKTIAKATARRQAQV